MSKPDASRPITADPSPCQMPRRTLTAPLSSLNSAGVDLGVSRLRRLVAPGSGWVHLESELPPRSTFFEILKAANLPTPQPAGRLRSTLLTGNPLLDFRCPNFFGGGSEQEGRTPLPVTPPRRTGSSEDVRQPPGGMCDGIPGDGGSTGRQRLAVRAICYNGCRLEAYTCALTCTQKRFSRSSLCFLR